MSKSTDEWKVLPHKPIEKLSDNLWRVQGSMKNMALRRVMTLAKRGDGAIVIHSAIALDEQSMADIEAWGVPGYLLVPNGFHRLDAGAFKARYPQLKVLCPPGCVSKVSEAVHVDGDYSAFLPDDKVRLEVCPGTGDSEGVMWVTSDDGVSVVLNDLLFNMPHGSGPMGWVFRYLTASTGGPKVSRLSKMFLVKDRHAAKGFLERLADTENLVRVIVSHHRMITDQPGDVLRQVAAAL